MRRLIAITALALSLAVPVWAQHGGGGHGGGGGHASGGGHGGGFSGGSHSAGFSGHSGGFSGSHSSSGVHSYSGPLSSAAPHSFSGNSTFSQRNFSRGPFLHDGGVHIGINTFNRYGYWGGRYGYPWWGWGWPWGYYDPWWWWNDNSYDNNDNGYDQNVAAASEMNRQNLEEQRMFRQEEADGDQDAYAPSYRAPRAAAGSEEHPVAMMPNTVLVFRDQHKEEIENYAIVGSTLWNFAPKHTEKISLADLDLPATTKANADRGVTFRIPVPGEAQ